MIQACRAGGRPRHWGCTPTKARPPRAAGPAATRMHARTLGRLLLLLARARQVLLLLQDEEGGHAQLALAQQLHAALRRAGGVHNNVVQRGAGGGHRHIVLATDGAQVAWRAAGQSRVGR